MIILASKSPRRRELLSLITTDFIVKSADADETLSENPSPREAVERLSLIKAKPFENENKTVIGADTVVSADSQILGKPENDDEAFKMLRFLSGREHCVYTGVTILNGKKTKTFSCCTKVNFFDLTDDEILAYIASGECSDKAGAYGIQGRGSLLVKEIHGDYFNVVGLPVSILARELRNFKL